jgi:hypothetical protein
MSTRATYRFIGRDFTPTVTIYIHSDGYEAGAAMYFHRMLKSELRGQPAVKFIRANIEAEITESHDIHGDTAYRYDIEGSGPEARVTWFKVSYPTSRGDDRNYVRIGSCTLREFCDANPRLIGDLSAGTATA